jgi:ABC-type arginine/histidine transport system permease subunit
MAALKEALPAVNETNTYWFFVIVTPLVFLVIYAGKRIANDQSALPGLRQWPWWKLFAATIAFAVWALAVPTTPYMTGAGGGAVAAFFATFVSVLLSMFAPLFERK